MRGSKREIKRGVWELRVSLGKDPVTEKYKVRSKTFHGSARAADEALRDLIDQQAPSRSDGMGATFGQLLDQCLEECERVDLSPTTLRTYRAQIKQTIRPRLGKVLLSRRSARNLDELYGAMKDTGASPKTIRNHHAIIAATLHQGVGWGWVRYNVAERAKPPRVEHQQVHAPSVDVVRKVIESAQECDPRRAPLLMLAALTGMRRGELCALRWSDVDLLLGIVSVARSLLVVPGGLAEKTTKTGRSRKVALDAFGIALLTEHHRQVTEWVTAAAGEPAPDAVVFFPFVEATTPFRPDNVTSFFIRVRNEVGAPDIRLHDLRHFTATQLIGVGVDVRTVADRLGDSDPSLTLRVYSHVIEERDRAAAAIMGNVLEPQPKQPAALPTAG